MIPVVSIVERVGTGGGGKVRAVQHRMNAFAEMAEFAPILLGLDHTLGRRINFLELQAQGALDPRVRYCTVPELCLPAAMAAGVPVQDAYPAWDRVERKGGKASYFQGAREVMTDRTRATAAGHLTRRSVPDPGGDVTYTLLDGVLHQKLQDRPDGTTERTDYAEGRPIRWARMKGRAFQVGKNLVTGRIARTARIFDCLVFEMIDWGDAVVFFDGVTSAYLSPVTKAARVLFLHADHRSPDGRIVPRSRFLIENFKGEAIVTSTRVHKAQMEVDLTPAAPIHVIPHVCEPPPAAPMPRRDLVTVSRLELTGKPIPDCIEAFCRIMHRFPGVHYLIYGVGAGHKALQAQIARLGCGDRVRLMGYTSQPLQVFASALAQVYPTTTEGFGLSILEALSSGCPVISHDVNYGPREVIRPGVNGELVPPGDITALAEAMARVLSDPAAYRKGTPTGLERYTRDAYRQNYRDLALALVPGRGKQAPDADSA